MFSVYFKSNYMFGSAFESFIRVRLSTIHGATICYVYFQR